MSLDQVTIEKIAEQIESAEMNAKGISKITDEFPEISYAECYDVQWAIRHRKEARGNKVCGLKVGLTSNEKKKQMGVDSPIYGFLVDDFNCPDNAEIKISEMIHPKVEAEIAFVTKDELRGPGCHIGSVLAATDFILPAIEVIDSRYLDFKFDLKSVIADNASSARFVTGGRMRSLDNIDLKTLGVVMQKNGEIVELGAGAAVLGHPAASVAELANLLAERGETIPAGTLILTGGITAAVSVSAGDSIYVKYQNLGTVSVRFI